MRARGTNELRWERGEGGDGSPLGENSSSWSGLAYVCDSAGDSSGICGVPLAALPTETDTRLDGRRAVDEGPAGGDAFWIGVVAATRGGSPSAEASNDEPVGEFEVEGPMEALLLGDPASPPSIDSFWPIRIGLRSDAFGLSVRSIWLTRS